LGLFLKPLKHGKKQVFFAFEIRIYGTFADIGLKSDIGDDCIGITAASKNEGRRFDDLIFFVYLS
jgi:hypothetical protein